jgi:hypothetical protein
MNNGSLLINEHPPAAPVPEPAPRRRPWPDIVPGTRALKGAAPSPGPLHCGSPGGPGGPLWGGHSHLISICSPKVLPPTRPGLIQTGAGASNTFLFTFRTETTHNACTHKVGCFSGRCAAACYCARAPPFCRRAHTATSSVPALAAAPAPRPSTRPRTPNAHPSPSPGPAPLPTPIPAPAPTLAPATAHQKRNRNTNVFIEFLKVF